MYRAFRTWSERLLRIPGAPTPPRGDEGSTRVFRAAPNFYYYLLLRWFIGTLVALFFVLPTEILPLLNDIVERSTRRIPLADFRPPFIIGALILGQRLFALALIRLDFEKRWYVVTDRSLRVREGIMRVREMTITFANIQNLSISQGPLQRLLGLSDLRVETAGGSAQKKEQSGGESTHGVQFRGVNNANDIRELITSRLRQLKDSGLGDRDDFPALVTSAPASAALVEPLRAVLAEATALRQAVAGAA
jgi:membrane protein YdbS with pleckstrin-like domain